MNLDRQIELVKEWGFQEYHPNNFKRNIFKDTTEYWTIHDPSVIDFADKDGNHTETYVIDWSLFK